MSKLLFLKGLPASGKSTYAKELADKGWIRVNKDDLRAMLNNGKWSKGNEKRVIKLQNQIIETALAEGKNVVVDDTNFAEYHKHRLYDLARKYKADFDEKFFDTPLQICLDRDAKRANGVGESVIMKMYNQYLKPKPAAYKPPAGSQKAILVDIDGTLAHMQTGKGYRSPYDWHRVMEDFGDPKVINLVQLYHKAGYKVIVMSGRDGVCRQDTEKWLEEYKIPYSELYMREPNDNRKDSIVKRELFDGFIRDYYNIEVVIDDRNQVVDMWRGELGLKVLQVAEGDF